MNKLQFTTGGAQLLLDNLVHMQTAYTEALQGLSSVYGNSFILSGIDLFTTPGGNIGYTAGWLVYQGEVMRFEESDLGVPTLGTSPYLVPYEVVDPAIGQILYEDGMLHEVHLLRRVRMEVPGSQPDFIALDTLLRVDNTYSLEATNFATDVIAATGLDAPKISMHLNRVSLSGSVELTGAMSYTPPKTILQNIPDIYRPANERTMLAYSDNTSLTPNVAVMKIKPNGEVSIETVIAGGDVINLDQLQWEI